MERDSFVFYRDWAELRKKFPAQASKLINAIIDYGIYGIEPTDPEILFGFELIRCQIDRDTKKYLARAERNRINGAKSKGAPEGNQNARKQPKQPTGLNLTENNPEQPKQPKQPDNVNVDVNVDVNVNDNVNSTEKSKANFFTPPTLEEVQAYIAEKGYSVDAETFVDFYESKGWMVGSNKMKNWRAAVNTWRKRNHETATTTNDHRQPDYQDARQRGEDEFARFASRKLRSLGNR